MWIFVLNNLFWLPEMAKYDEKKDEYFCTCDFFLTFAV